MNVIVDNWKVVKMGKQNEKAFGFFLILAICPLLVDNITPSIAGLPTFSELDISDGFGIDFNSVNAEDYNAEHDDIGVKSLQSDVIKAVALLRGPNTNGVVRLTQVGSGSTMINGYISGLYPLGQHGFHVHQHRVSGGDCESAGPHYNPTKQNHGSPNSVESHIGDLGNIQADQSGVSRFDVTSDKISLRGKFSVIERALVVHINQDDLGMGHNRESLESGNSGSRIACGTIKFVSISKN